MYPHYTTIANAKTVCYPEHINIFDSGIKINFISLLDHTIKRILIILNKSELQDLNHEKLVLLGKWGMDEASSQQMTRQSHAFLKYLLPRLSPFN